MYADRYTQSRGLSPGGIAFALGVSGVVVLGLSLSESTLVRIADTPFTAVNIPLEKHIPPPPPHEQPKVKVAKTVAAPRDPVDVTPTIVPVAGDTAILAHTELPPPATVLVGSGIAIGTVVVPHAAVLRDPQLDSRYSDAFQPAYPSDERLSGREGRVVVRVLIGTDGRVKDVRQESAASPAFFEATRKQALGKWRFKPGTRDGVAVEAWYTMAVRFVLNAE